MKSDNSIARVGSSSKHWTEMHAMDEGANPGDKLRERMENRSASLVEVE